MQWLHDEQDSSLNHRKFTRSPIVFVIHRSEPAKFLGNFSLINSNGAHKDSPSRILPSSFQPLPMSNIKYSFVGYLLFPLHDLWSRTVSFGCKTPPKQVVHDRMNYNKSN